MTACPELTPIACLHNWFKKNQELFSAKCILVNFKNTGHGSAYIDLDTEFYISRITAWDHAICLNIEIIEIETEQSLHQAEGACDTIYEFQDKLGAYLSWLEKQKEK